MDIVLLKDIVIGAAAVLSSGLAIWTFMQSPAKKNADAIEKAKSDSAEAITKINRKLIEHDRRIQSVEGELKHLPDKEAVHELKLAIVELQGTVKAQNVQLGAVAQLVANIDGYMRKGDEK